ncbi:MarR family transcriptional regulator [Actinokineospora sp. G85]|uniref:MarR family transcriptional regulator n=1 Tax=Actinokineospora sp. G85 TaxID=3406626 RepID=UPI003C711E6D
MEYSHNDADLIKQPIGYWSWAAGEAVVTRTRTALREEFGITQPQWWVLNQVSSSAEGKTRKEVTAVLQGYLDVGEGLGPEIETTVQHGWVIEDPQGRLRATTEGRQLHDKVAGLQDRLWAERHEGISDEEYLITLKVLQRMIHNVGGAAWHH